MKIDIGGAVVLVVCLAACAPALAAVVKAGQQPRDERPGDRTGAAEAADLVLEGGVIVTLDDARPRATALAVKGGASSRWEARRT